MRLFTLSAAVVALTIVAAAGARADSAVDRGPASERNFVTLLRPGARPADRGGLLSFRQPRDAEKIVFLDVWVLNLARNHRYSLQRATDTTVDDHCTGTNWLSLGRGAVPEAIETNRHGSGGAHLFRDLSASPTGTRFDISFRVVDAGTSAVALLSACNQFKVSP